METITCIIPTLNRPQELNRLLQSFLTQTQFPNEIIIVDQGQQEAKDAQGAFVHDVITQYASLAIQYYQVDFQSLTRARNFGIQKSSGDIIGFLDDDMVLDPTYVEKVALFFNTHHQALGVQGIITNFKEGHTQKVGGNKLIYKIYNIIAKFFLLNNSSSKNRLMWSGRNQYACKVEAVINCEWLSGIGVYRRKVFDEFRFDEALEGYALGEDKLFSYPIFETYPLSLCIDPAIRCEHRHAITGRPLERAWVEMKINYTYYVWKKLCKKYGFFAYISYIWANCGDLLVVFLSVLLRHNSLKFLWWHIKIYGEILWKRQETKE